MAVPLIHGGGGVCVCRTGARAGETRRRHKKESGKSAEELEEERKLLAPTSLTSRETGAGDFIPSLYDFSALARTSSVYLLPKMLSIKAEKEL